MAIDARLHNPYLPLMTREHISRSIACGLLSIFLVALLVTAPLCAARCASSLCTPVSSTHAAETCHHSSLSEGNAPSLSAAAKHPCPAPELFFTSLRPEGFSSSVVVFVVSVGVIDSNATSSTVASFSPTLTRSWLCSSSASFPLRF
jgi:hypothetical protein